MSNASVATRSITGPRGGPASGEGTLLVFSNCQMAHRVLRMWNDSGREAYRDFVALFILDPAFPPLKLGMAELGVQLATRKFRGPTAISYRVCNKSTHSLRKKQSPASYGHSFVGTLPHEKHPHSFQA